MKVLTFGDLDFALLFWWKGHFFAFEGFIDLVDQTLPMIDRSIVDFSSL